MQSTACAFLAFTTFVYISSTISTVYGFRCSGKWAIHACYGGSGKRSGPPLSSSPSASSSSSSLASSSSESDLNNKQYILRQLLLSDRLAPSFPATNDIVLDSENMATDVDSIYPDVDEFSRSKDIEKIRSLLGEWLMQRRFRDALSGDYDYRR